MNELLRPIAELLDDEELATFVERARLDAQTGVEGIPVGDDEAGDDEAGDDEAGDDEVDDDEDEREEVVHAREHSLFLRGVVGLRFAARAYTLRKDAAGLRPIVWGSWALTAERFDMHLTPVEMIAGAVQRVGPRLREVPGLAERLARSPSAWVRRALARALPESEEGILRELAEDDDPEVREVAIAKVGALDEWGGAFPIAPDGHPHEVLEAAREVLDFPPHKLGRDAERAVVALAPLSDALALACWERLLSREPASVEGTSTWIAEMLARPGGGAALARVAARWKAARGRTPTHEPWLNAAKTLDEPIRARATEELLASLREEADETIRGNLAEAVKRLAPERGDARALLETILGAPLDRAAGSPSEGDAVAAMYLSEVLARWPLEPVLEALIEARRAGKPGAWSRVGHGVWSRLGPDPVLRERARAELASEDVKVRRGAVAVLLGEHRDEGADALARELYRDGELRAAVLSYRPRAVMAEARLGLERGELGLLQTIIVLSNTPAEEQTDAMWAAVRAVRSAALAGDEKERKRALSGVDVLVRAGDAWDPSDFAFVREVAELALSDDEEAWLLSSLVPLLERLDTPESEALLGELDERASEEAREYIDDVRTRPK